MIIYIFFFLLLFTFLKLSEEKYFEASRKIAFLIIFIISALRFDVGYDYMYYYSILNKTIKYYGAMLDRLEILNKVLINFSQEFAYPQLYFIITSFLILYPIYKTINKYSKDFTISTLIFLSLPIFFFNSLSIVRQYVAISLIFYSFKYIKNRNIYKFLLFIGIAFCFHKSAILAIVLYWLYGLEFKNIYYYVIYLLGFFSSAISYYLVKFLMPQYLIYLDNKIGTGGDKMLILFQFLGFFLLFFVNKKNKDGKNYNFYFTTFYIGLFIWSSLSSYGHAGFRGSLYFTIFFILLIPELLHKIKQRKILKIATYVLLSFAFLFTLYLGKLNPHKDPNIPYRIYFLTDQSSYKNVK